MICITQIVRYGASITQEKLKAREFFRTQVECLIVRVMCIGEKNEKH